MAKFCTQCGATLPDETRFCTECGATLPGGADPAPPPPQAESPIQSPPPQQSAPPPQQPVYQQPAYQQPAPPAPPPIDPDRPPKGSKYEPISTGGFIGIFLLLCIPIIGFILMIVWACGGCRKVTKRALARAMLIFTAITLVITLVLGLTARSFIKNILEEAGISTSQISGKTGSSKNDKSSGGLLSGLLGGSGKENEEDSPLGGLGALAGLLGGDQSGGTDLNELEGLLDALGGLTGEDTGGDDLIDEIGEINKEASKNSNGWPSDLPDFPGGTMNEVENYRTEFTGTTLEDTKAYIKTLKNMGYEYQDFYDFGMSEEDMMEYGGWWGYNGKWYISISYSEGVTIIDHVTELPDMSDLLGG